jgi:hypothetical protein
MGGWTRHSGRPSGPSGWVRWAKLLAGVLALGAVVLATAHGRVETVPDGSSVIYALCKGNLASLQILPPRKPGESFAIAAQLDRGATKELEGLTQQNVGGSLEIAIGDWTFVRGPIRSALRSGLLVNTAFATRDEAEAWIGKLRSELSESPCGRES